MKLLGFILSLFGLLMFLQGYGQKQPAIQSAVVSSMEKVPFELDKPVASVDVAKINAAGEIGRASCRERV